jgi:hypothetical protein
VMAAWLQTHFFGSFKPTILRVAPFGGSLSCGCARAGNGAWVQLGSRGRPCYC